MGRNLYLCFGEALSEHQKQELECAVAFQKKEEIKSLELPTLIDVVFLLLIFFLVTISLLRPGLPSPIPGPPRKPFDLPEAKGSKIDGEKEILETLLIQIERKDEKDPLSPKLVYTLWPSIKDSVTLEQARAKAKEDSLFAEFPPNFLSMGDQEFANSPPCSLIAKSIKDYKNLAFKEPGLSNFIEIRAIKDTEFRIINFIMIQCSAYEDTIPKLVFRTLSEKRREESGL